MPSQRKLEANRRNAQKSTGPKTPEGKAISSRNALKHGLFARDVVLPHEARREFNKVLAALREAHQPATPEEDSLVQAVAAAQWRLHRLIRMETGPLLRMFLETGEYAVFFKLARYEILVHRHFYRALNALNFYQARRAGQPPPRAI